MQKKKFMDLFFHEDCLKGVNENSQRERENEIKVKDQYSTVISSIPFFHCPMHTLEQKISSTNRLRGLAGFGGLFYDASWYMYC